MQTRISSLFVIFTLVFAVMAASEPSQAGEQSAHAGKRTLSLSATGSVNVRPDTAHITVGVVSEAESARSAMDDNNAAMADVIEVLEEKDIASKDIQTTNFAVHPRYQHFDDDKPSVISGYRVVNSIRITVRDIARLGEVLDKVVGFGSNQIGGISFSVSEPDALMDEARTQAIETARERADLYADAAGASVGEVLRIEEVDNDGGPEPRFRAMAAKAESDVPIEAGETEIKVRVRVVWALNDQG
ncbi:MAG: SIMPL domain-containing protein [Dichotomicrobium sp.]